MRKLSFYPKLALGNLWRNKTTYGPFLLASVVCIFTMYSLLAIKGSGSLSQLRGAEFVDIFINIGIFLLGIFCIALLFWTNSFLIKRRKKELALYSVLGMEKGNIGIVMLFETLFVAIAALVLGLASGILLSRMLFWGLLQLLRYEIMLNLPICFPAIGAVCTYFAIVFGLTLLSNLRQVRMANPMQLMAGAKQGEQEPKSSVFVTILGVLCLATGYGMALYFKSPIEAILIFLVAAFFVIVGTFCLFTSGSVAVLKLARKNKGFYYTPKHFISVSGMIYRMKQNAAGLATISILSCMVLVTVAASVGLYTGMNETLDQLYPFDFQAYSGTAESTALLREEATELAAAHNISIVDEKSYEYYNLIVTQQEDGSYVSANSYDGDVAVMYLVTQQQVLQNEGYDLQLAPDDILLYRRGGYTGNTFTLDGITTDITVSEIELPVVQNNIAGTAGYILLVVPNEATMQQIVEASVATLEFETEERRAAASTTSYQYKFNIEGSEQDVDAFHTAVETSTTGMLPMLNSRRFMQEELYYMNGGFLFLGIFFGALFLMATTLIIYYKQISEGYDDAERFDILQKVGMSEDEVRKTISSQVRSVFFLPLLVAIVHIAVAFVPIRRGLTIMAVFSPLPVALSFAVTMLAYTLVYLLVYRRTAAAYFRIVRRAA